MSPIRTAVRTMEEEYSKRGHLSDGYIQGYAESLAAKMRGEIRSSIVKPVVGQVASMGFAALEERLISIVTPELYQQAEHEVMSGVAAGDESGIPVPNPPMPDQEALENIKESIEDITDYVYKDFEGIINKLQLSQENLEWAKNNKLDAAKAVGNWVLNNPEEALNIGLTGLSLIHNVRAMSL